MYIYYSTHHKNKKAKNQENKKTNEHDYSWQKPQKNTLFLAKLGV